MVKVRFAPSPTGIPHIGNTRTALFNYLFAKANKGEFILRIEDTDQTRIVEGAEEAIFEILDWLGLKHDGEVVHQSERLEIYKEHAEELVKKDIAYKKEGAIWVKVPDDKTFSWLEALGDSNIYDMAISFKGQNIEDFVILKSDGFPTYHLANVIDDHLMKITHVIRGEEWISSTPKHIYLYESFGWKPPIFAHLPVILGPDKTKLSKRHGAKSILDYRDEGFLKEALLNFMVLLGWNPGDDRERISLEEMKNLFNLERINHSNPIFDIKKLESLNGAWIRNIKDLDKRLENFYKSDKYVLGIIKGEKGKSRIESARSRMKTLADFKELVVKNPEVIFNELQTLLAEKLEETYQVIPVTDWKKTNISTATQSARDNLESSTKDVYTVLTGKPQGLPYEDTLEFQGKAGTVTWLNEVIKKNRK